MLSILIPTYNYNIVSLVTQLHKQAKEANIVFEIIVIDDASTNLQIIEENKNEITSLSQVSYINSIKNQGREITRQKLAKIAQFNWLLFIDADTIPKKNTFIIDYLDSIKGGSKLIFGGIAYSNNKPEDNAILRWKYGKSREEVSVNKRNKNRYLSINSGCFLIDKTLFITTNSKIVWKLYGLDIFFTYLLMKYKVKVLHINNPVYHLGLENGKVFLEKSKKAANTLYFLENERLISPSYSSLQKAYNKLVQYRLANLFRFCVKHFIPYIEKNLKTKNPSLFWFDVYRLYFFSTLSIDKTVYKSKKSA